MGGRRRPTVGDCVPEGKGWIAIVMCNQSATGEPQEPTSWLRQWAVMLLLMLPPASSPEQGDWRERLDRLHNEDEEARMQAPCAHSALLE